jgi:Ca2+-binding EF-hand superfamily protein
MKSFLLGGIAAAVLSTVAMAQVPAAQPAQQRAAKVQARSDVAAKVQQHFARVDANRDDSITQAEVQALQVKKGERQSRRAVRQERRDPVQMFQRLDLNKDGQVTRAEFDARRSGRAQAQAPQRAQRGEQRFARLDTDRNGALTRAEFDAGRQLREQRTDRRGERMQRRGANGGRFAGHMFAIADANKDGRVTLQEAQSAALHHFDMADANRDGQVTRDERRQMRQNMRQQGGHAGHQG